MAVVGCDNASLDFGRVLTDARILVVDDNRVNIHLLTAILERSGIKQVGKALDGMEALEIIDGFQPDLMLLDLMMPRLDGYETCRQLRTQPAYRDLPILIQSSLNRPEDRARAFAAGATDYVSKPINAPELIARVRIHLQNRFLLRSLQAFRERFENELDTARRMQERLLPQPQTILELERFLGIEIMAHFWPSSELGGDLWGLRGHSDDQLVVWLVDFSGHGAAAALHTFSLHATLRQMAMESLDPGEFLKALNRRLRGRLPVGQFATMLIGVLDLTQNHFRYASAAATKPLIWTDNTAPLLEGENLGLPLGIVPEVEYQTQILPYPPGARLLLYSDAAVEISHKDEILDESGFFDLVSKSRTNDGNQLETILSRLFEVGPLDDDLTAILITRQTG